MDESIAIGTAEFAKVGAVQELLGQLVERRVGVVRVVVPAMSGTCVANWPTLDGLSETVEDFQELADLFKPVEDLFKHTEEGIEAVEYRKKRVRVVPCSLGSSLREGALYLFFGG